VSDPLRQDTDTLRAIEEFLYLPWPISQDERTEWRTKLIRARDAFSRLVAAAETTQASQVLSAENLTAEAAEPPVGEVCGSAMIACSLPAGHESYHRAAAGQIWYGPYYDKPATTTATQSSPECDGSSDCKATTHVHGCFSERPSVGASERLTALRARADGFYGLVANDPEAPHTEIVNDVRALLGLVDKLTKERDDTGSVISALEGAKRWAARARAAEAAADRLREAARAVLDYENAPSRGALSELRRVLAEQDGPE
jgi:hypothetical protein